MESCQVCGREAVGEGFVEGAKVPLCNRCIDHASKFDVYDDYKPHAPEKKFVPKAQVVERFVDGWAQKIKSGREKKGWDRLELGKRLFISETDIKAFEDGRRKPEPGQREKIERELGISLVESEVLDSVEKTQTAPPKPGQALTLGDLVKIKKK
ncbi:TIGR00270 family protein [Candidatus Micrarchaeota archaeon]|nr:TIGR00270 family protein [Candidatus Micrarchaeota archaeon]